jgi:competence protein ComEC
MKLVYIALAWTAGIVIAARTDTRQSLIWLALAILALAAVWLSRGNRGRRMTAIVLAALALGGLRVAITPTTSDIATYNGVGGMTIDGVIVDVPDVRDDRIQVRVAAETVTRAGGTLPTSGLVLVEAPRTADLRYGDRITATGQVVTPAVYDTFSYADYLAFSGVYSVMPNAAVEVVSRGSGSPIYAALIDLKRSARHAIESALPEPQAGLLSGILLGDARGIAPDVQQAFATTGTAHIIAISGFNMVVLSELVRKVLHRFHSRRWLTAAPSILLIIVYTVLVGASPAVVRAALMSTVLVIGQALRRKTYVPASLALVALLLSAANPLVLWDIGFQLSFFAVLGLALFADPLSRRFDTVLRRVFPSRIARLAGDALTEPLMVSLAALLTTLPLTALFFGRLSPITLIINVLIIPVQPALLIIGGLGALVAALSPMFAQILFWLDLVLLSWTIDVVRLFARLPFADTAVSLHPTWAALFFIVLIGGAMLRATRPRWAERLGNLVQRRAVVTTTLLAGIATALLTSAVAFSRPDGKLHVWFLDSGHSNSVLVQTAGGAQILIDGGRFPSRLLSALGDRMPFNDREIDVLVITQPDEFDVGALPAVLERYQIGVLLRNGQPNQGETWAAIEQALAGTEAVTVRAGYSAIMDDGTKLEVLNPQRQPDLTDSLDDSALVLRVTFGDISYLLASDVSAAGQAGLLDAGQWPLATVMQLPHHGAARSLDAAFLAATQPQLIVLQSDAANRLGDPNPDTLALLGNVPLYRTDEGGTIHTWTDGYELWIETEKATWL